MQRRDLVNALAQSVIDSSAKEIQVKTEQELDKAVKEKIDKTFAFISNESRANLTKMCR